VAKISRSLAIVIGIDQYTHIRKLKNAVNDAKELADVLEKRYKYKVLRLVEDGDATSEKLSHLLKNLDQRIIQIGDELIKVEESDRILFYFAGHGFPEETEESEDGKPAGYLMPQDSQQNDKNTWLSMQKLHDALTSLDCRHLLMILDCCFAGRILWAGLKRNAGRSRKMYRQSYDRFIKFPAQQVITSAAHDEEAQDLSRFGQRGGKNGHSPFANLLLKVLKAEPEKVKEDISLQAIIDDGVITAHELFTYLQNKLGDDTEKQTPGLFHLKKHNKGEYIFELPDFKQENLEKLKLNESTNPYKGLASFEKEDSQLFFGRKRLIEGSKEKESLLSKVSNHPLTVVLGLSGSGKSSLVKAGLIPALISEEKTSQERWYVLEPMRPGEVPINALASAILPIKNVDFVTQLTQFNFLDDILKSKTKQEQESGLNNEEKENFNILVKAWERASPEAKLSLVLDYFEQLEKLCIDSDKQQLKKLNNNILETFNLLINEIQDSQFSLTAIVKQWSLNNPHIKLLLIIDQFEELITLCKDKDREYFLQLLAEALAAPELSDKLRIVITLRSDFEPQIRDTIKENYWQEAWQHGRFFVTPMEREELKQAIEEPAAQRALFFESPKLVNDLIDEVVQMPGALPLLSFTLSELYLKYLKAEPKGRIDRTITEADYREIGGVTRSLTQTADKAYNELVKEETGESTICDVMLRMISITGGELARRRVPASELDYPQPKNEQVQKVINRFVEARLLVKDLDAEGQEYIEPAHDALVKGWVRLKEWIDKELDGFVLRQRLTAAANDWAKNPQDSGLLLPNGDRLNQLEKVLKSENSWFNQKEAEFVERSIHKRREQERKNLENQVKLNTTESQRLFTANDRLDAIAKMIEAGEYLKESSEKGLKITKYKELSFLITFNQLLSECREIKSIDIGDPVNNFSCNQLTQVVATVSGDYNKVCIWDWQGKQINFEDNEERIYDLAFSPDGKTLVTSGEDGIVKFYSRGANGWKAINSIQDGTKNHRGNVYCVNFSRDRNILVSGGQDGRIIVWSEESFIPEMLMQQSYHISQVVFHPTNKLIAFTQFSSGNNVEYSDSSVKNNVIFLEYDVSHDGKYHTCQDCKYPQIETGWDEGIAAIDFSPNGKFLVAGSLSGDIQIWSISKDKKHTFLTMGDDDRKQPISYVAFSPDGEMLATSHTNGIINLWDTSQITDAPSLYPLQKLKSLAGHKQNITRVSFGLDSKCAQLLSSSDDGAVKVWSLKDKFEPYVGDKVRKINFSADQQIITTVDESGDIKLWKTNGEPLEPPFENKDEIGDAQLSRDNEVVVAVGWDGMIKLYELDGTKLDSPIDQHNQAINQLTFSPSENIFVTVSRSNTIDIWRFNRDPLNVAWSKTLTRHHEQITAISFSDDGTFFAVGSADGTVILWHLDADQPVTTISNVGGRIIHLSLSGGGINGKMISVVVDSKTEGYKIKLYRYLNKNVKEFWCSVPTGRIRALRFYDENKTIVSIDAAGCIGIWSIELTTGLHIDIEALKEREPQEATVKHALGKMVEAAAFGSTGEEIVMATCLNNRDDSYRKIHTLTLDIDSLLKEARDRRPNYAG
jgi:WD40 repeat protein